MNMKPILFNTEMVQAILYGRKTQTRRCVKPFPVLDKDGWWQVGKAVWPQSHVRLFYQEGDPLWGYAPCNPDDILWVRETWYKDAGRYMYKADYAVGEKFFRNGKEVAIRWHPSIHMPKEAARIFLRVKEVRLERLQGIKNYECVDEGAVKRPNITKRGDLVLHNRYREEFARLWGSTIKPTDRDKYGWDANPWVWVIEFERCKKPDNITHWMPRPKTLEEDAE